MHTRGVLFIFSSSHQPSLGCQMVECRVRIADQRARFIQLCNSPIVQHHDPVAHGQPMVQAACVLEMVVERGLGGACLLLSSTVLMRWAMVSTVQSANSRRMASWISWSATCCLLRT
jgi:hypothetical protein